MIIEVSSFQGLKVYLGIFLADYLIPVRMACVHIMVMVMVTVMEAYWAGL